MGALSGLKILDFSTLLPGPLATMLMADLGAEVVSVSAPGRPDLLNRYPPLIEETGLGAVYSWLGRNKKSILLDLKKPEGIAAVKELVKSYDIVVEQFRPGVMKKFGLDYDSLKEINPRLIYCSITGYGQTGPLALKADHDINYVALSGNMILMDGKAPNKVNIPNFHLADIAGGGYMSVIAILSAVHYREQTGEGQYIDSSMFDSVLPFNCVEAATMLASEAYPENGFRGRHMSGVMNGPHYDVYETKDKKYISVGPLEPKFLAVFCDTLGVDQKTLKEAPEEFRQQIKDLFLTKTRSEWMEVFEGKDTCVEPVLDITETWKHEQVLARNMAAEVPLSTAPEKCVKQIGNPVRLSKTPAEYRHTAFPQGYHTREVLSAAGLSEEMISALTE